MLKGDNLQLLWRDSFHKDEEKYGHKCWFFHRVELHEGLRGLALDPRPAERKPATISLSSEVTDIDCDGGILTLVSGTKIKKDLIVVADGAHVSKFFLPPKSLYYSALTCRSPKVSIYSHYHWT